MKPRSAFILALLAITISAISFLLGSYVFPHQKAETDLASGETAVESTATAGAGVFRSYGIAIDDTAVDSQPPSSMAGDAQPLDAEFLRSLTAPAKGHLMGTVARVDAPAGSFVILAQRVDMLDQSGSVPVMRSLVVPAEVTIVLPQGASVGGGMPEIAQGDVVALDVDVRPSSSGSPASIVMTAMQRLSAGQ